jgi:CTD kinase subunit gamma
MYFIEHLCDLANREGHLDYVRNVERDLPRIIELVAPSNKGGATNIKVVRKVGFQTITRGSAFEERC